MAGPQTVPSELKSFLRSVLVSSNGVKESKVEKDYRELAGERLDWRKLGFKSLREFLCAVPDVCRLQYSTKDKENCVYAVEVKGIYMSSHAKKNVKSASNVQLAQSNTDTTPPSLMPPSGRRVQQDGDSLKITVSETPGGNEMLPNKSGFYQVYVAKLPPDCTESDLKISFSKYGDVKEAYIVTSSRNQKIGFVRYASKQEALRALMEGKNTPPVIRGQSLDVGEAKCKNVNDVETSVNAVLNCEPKNGINVLPPISTQISTPSSPKRSSAYEQPQKTPSALSVFKNDMQDKHFSVGDSVDGSAETLNEPLFSVNISGYINQKMKEADLRMILQNVGHIEQFEYHPLYSIVKFKTRNEAMNTLSSVNGMFVGGSALFVTALSWPVEEHTVKSKPDELERNDKVKSKPDELERNDKTEAKTKQNEAKQDKVKEDEMTSDEVNKDEVEEDKISEIYNLYSEAIVMCCGQSYQKWLNTLPPVFGMEVLEVIDPCTFWARISDGTTTHEQFNDLINRLQFIDPLSNKKLLEKNEFGIGQFSEDGEWYRCYCYDVSPNGKHLRVMYIDYGNCEWLERDKVVRLPPAFRQLQPQGVLVKLSGLRYKLNKKSVNSSTLLCAKQLLMGSGQPFKARKASLDPTKPLLLEVEILQSEGEAIYKKLSCQPGIEVTPRSASPPVQHLLLSSPPLPPDNLQPLKKGLVVVKSDVYYIWITHITSQTTFYFQLVNAVSREAISEIQEYLSKCDLQNKINIRNIKGETLVCYHRNGRERSRVKLLTSSRHIVPGQVNVLHVDIGKEAMVPCTSFISLPLGANKFPYQARPASLYNVPDLVYSQSSAALDFIIQQSNKVLRANVVAENRDESVIVELFDFNGESINKQMLEIISNEHATHAQARNPGGRALSNKNSSISNDTVQSHIQPLMMLKISPPQDSLTVDTSFSVTSRESTSRQSTPTDIAGAQGNRNGFKKVSPEEKPFDGTAGKHVFPQPNLASSQNHVSSQSAWNLGSNSQCQISPTSPSKLGPNEQNQDIPMSPSKFGSSSQNRDIPTSSSKLGSSSLNQDFPTSLSKFASSSKSRDISTSPSKLGPNGQNQDIPTSPSKFASSSQNRDIPTSCSKLGSSSLNQDLPTSLSKFASSSLNQDLPTSLSKLGHNSSIQVSPTSPSKFGSSSENRDIPTSLSKFGSSSENRDIPTSLSKFGSSSLNQDFPTSLSKLGHNSSIQVSPTSPSKFGPSSQNHVGPTSFSKFGHSDQNHVSPPNVGPVGKTNSNSSPSPLFGEPKTNVPIQVAKKAEALSKTPTGNTRASQSNVENQTSPFTLKQGSLSASSSPAFGKPNQTNLQDQASHFLLKQGNPVETLVTPTTTTNSLNSTTKSPTVVDRAEGSKSSVKTKQQNTKNSKSSYDEKPANEKQVPKDLPPIKYVTSGGRNVTLPTPSNAQKNACGSAKGRRWYNDRALASKVISYGELKKKIEEQERILSRSASEQRHQLAQRKMKEKLEVQLRIKKLEKAVFALQNEMQSLNFENDTLEKQLHQK